RDFHVTGVQTCALPIFGCRDAKERKTMTTISNSPDQPILDAGRFDWESEETLVDRRNRLPNRIRRFLRNGLIWKIPLAMFIIGRSEERRVGKGGSFEWS